MPTTEMPKELLKCEMKFSMGLLCNEFWEGTWAEFKVKVHEPCGTMSLFHCVLLWTWTSLSHSCSEASI